MDVRLIYGPYDGHEQDYGVLEELPAFPKEAWFGPCCDPHCGCGGRGIAMGVLEPGDSPFGPEWASYLLDHVDAGCGVYRYADTNDGGEEQAPGFRVPIRRKVRDEELVPA